MDRAQQGVQSVEVAGRLLRVLVDHGQSMMLRDLANAAGMAAAKVHRYLVSLQRLGLVAQDPRSGRYDLANFALELGLARQARVDVIAADAEELEKLRDATQETVQLAVWGEKGATVVRVLEAHGMNFFVTRVGAVMPLTSSATGLVFAAFLPHTMTHDLISKDLEENRRSSAGRGPKTKKDLDAVLGEIIKHGLARVQGTVTRGINALSAPIFDHESKLVAAITVLGPERRLDVAWEEEAAAAVSRAASNVSLALGHLVSREKSPRSRN
jgi:DNA-binding IclR family transcriptional regulator